MKDRTGEIGFNACGSKMIILEYRKAIDIDVYFPEYDWEIKNTRYQQFEKRTITCPYEKSVLNVGYSGEGKYNKSINQKLTSCYQVWSGMLRRCYEPYTLNTNRHKEYRDVKVCDEWHNFQNFAQWYEDNYYEIDGESMQLDKDILIKNNKVYSPKTCIFVPKRINLLFVKNDNHRGDLPLGVSLANREAIEYVARCNIDGKCIIIGKFNDVLDAFNSYKVAKEKHIKDVADNYIDKIPSKLYDAMYEYNVEIND